MFRKLNITLSLLISILSFCLNLNESCNSNLDCVDSACCRKGVCITNDMCRQDMINIYLAVGLVGACFLVAAVLYFFSELKLIRANVREIKKDLNKNKENESNRFLNQIPQEVEMKNVGNDQNVGNNQNIP